MKIIQSNDVSKSYKFLKITSASLQLMAVYRPFCRLLWRFCWCWTRWHHRSCSGLGRPCACCWGRWSSGSRWRWCLYQPGDDVCLAVEIHCWLCHWYCLQHSNIKKTLLAYCSNSQLNQKEILFCHTLLIIWEDWQILTRREKQASVYQSKVSDQNYYVCPLLYV